MTSPLMRQYLEWLIKLFDHCKANGIPPSNYHMGFKKWKRDVHVEWQDPQSLDEHWGPATTWDENLEEGDLW